MILHGAFYIFGIGISIAEKTKYFAYSYLIGAAANIALNLVMIPRHGAMGAAVATVISFAIVALLGGYWSKRAYPLDFPFRKLILACLLFLIFNAIGVLIDTTLGGSLLIKTLTLVVFAILMFLLLDRDDRSLLSKASTKLAGNRMKGFLWK